MLRLAFAGLVVAGTLASPALAAEPCKNTDEAYRRLVWLEHEAMQQYLDKKIPPDTFAQLFKHKLAGLDQEVNGPNPLAACKDITSAAKESGVDLGWTG